MMTAWKNLSTAMRGIVSGSIVVLLLVVILATLSWCHERGKARKAQGEATVAESQGNLGSDAMKRADDLNAANREGAALTEKNTDFIIGADNAKTDAGEAGDRGRLTFCERQRVRGKPEPQYCAGLRGAYSDKP